MGEQKPASWYDEQSKRIAERDYLFTYDPPWPKTARWPGRFREVCKELDMTEHVVDLGCGPGLFAAYLWHQGHRPLLGGYVGVDFSKQVIAKARAGNSRGSGNPHTVFFVEDVTKGLLGTLFQTVMPAGGQVTILETLEHLEDDLSVVESIPEGSRTVITVPRFDEPDHVRFFDKPKEVVERYGQFFDGVKVRKIQRNWILLRGVRK